MGFFSDILGVVAPIAGAFLGIPQAPPPAPTQLAPIAPVQPQPVAAPLLFAKGGGGQLTMEEARKFALTQPLTGRMRKITIVRTIDPGTGRIIKERQFAGGVAVFASDVAAANRVFRQVSKLGKRLPRKIVKTSEVKQLTDRVVKNALERAGDCPPKCP